MVRYKNSDVVVNTANMVRRNILRRWIAFAIAGVATLMCVLLLPSTAHATAQDYEVCIRLPVSLDDELDDDEPYGPYPDELGHAGDWKARGIRVSYVKLLGITTIFGPDYADLNSGCITMNLDLPQAYNATIKIVSRGIVSADNEIRVIDENGDAESYIATITLDPADPDQIFTWPDEEHMLRTYAITAYSVNSFLGGYNDELLKVWWYENSYDPDDTFCEAVAAHDTVSGVANICLNEERSLRKFVIAHEYGHCNLDLAISTENVPKDCTWDDQDFHDMQGGYPEYTSCAAMEGWANFVAADVWNDNIHGGGDPNAWVRYWKADYEVISADNGHGGCADSYRDESDYRRAYADTCFDSSPTWDDATECSSGDCDGVGYELDWMRTFYDYHTDTTYFSHGTVSHQTLHDDLKDALSWGHTTFWDDFYDATDLNSPNRADRLEEVADWEGTSEP